jgi:hypothetical protein
VGIKKGGRVRSANGWFQSARRPRLVRCNVPRANLNVLRQERFGLSAAAAEFAGSRP